MPVYGRIWLLLLATMLPLFVLETLSQANLRKERETEIQAIALRLLNLLNSEQRRIADDIRHTLFVLAETGLERDGFQGCQAVLDRLAKRFPSHQAMEVTDTNGIVRCAINQRSIGIATTDVESFRAALATNLPVMGKVDRGHASTSHSIPFRLRIDTPSGVPAAVVSVRLDRDWLRDLLTHKPMPPNTRILLTDRDGFVLASVPDIPKMKSDLVPPRLLFLLKGDGHSAVETDALDGVLRVIAYAPPGPTGTMMLAVGVDKVKALYPVDMALMRSLGLFGAVLILSAMGAAWGVRKYLKARDTLTGDMAAKQQLLEAVLRSVPAGLFAVEAPTGKLLFVSMAAERLLGQPATEAWRLDEDGTHGAIHEDGTPYRVDEYPTIRALSEGKEVEQEEMLYRRRDGRIVAFIVNALPVRNEVGDITMAVGAFTDITSRKEIETALRKSDERLNLALQAADAGTFDWDLQTNAVTWSVHCFHLFGLTPGQNEPSFEAWAQILHPDDFGRVLDYVQDQTARRRTHAQASYRVLHPDGTVRWIETTGRITYDEDRPVRMLGLSMDITDRRRMEDELRQAKQSAEHADRAKSKFLAAASHDLRQPLQSMFLFLGALQEHVHSDPGKQTLAVLERNLDALKGLLDSLIDVSRLDASLIQPNIEDFAIGSILDEIVTAFTPAARNKGLYFSSSGSCAVKVRSDRHLLGRILRNLVENAIKFTDRGGVRLTCSVSDGRVRIDVHDTGIGIPADQQEQIFVEFHQIGNPARDRSQGIGLGLSIVQRLGKLLNHPVLVRSTPGEGTVFSIDVPLGAAEMNETSTQTSPTRQYSGGGRLAVLVDDEPNVLQGLEALLHAWGFETVTGTSTEQALERLLVDGRTPVVILADYRLSNHRTGLEAIQSIRQHAGSTVPGIILTGETTLDWEPDAVAQQLKVIIKPVSPRILSELLESMLGAASTS